jgi:excisionase family DNA binding protein
MTPREISRLLRVGIDKVMGWIHAGVLQAVNVGRLGRPRYVILPEHLEAFVRGRSASPPPRAPRRRRLMELVDYYPD